MGRVRLALALATTLLLCGAGAAAAGTFVYVHDRGLTNQVFAFSLAKDGSLTEVPGSPFVGNDPNGNCGGLCQTMAFDKKSARLFTSGPTGVSVWNVGTDGALTLVPGSPFGPLADPLGTAVVRFGKRLFVYTSESDAAQVRGFEVQSDGSLVELPTSPFPADDGADGMAAAKGKLFVANENVGTVSSFAVQPDGSLVEAPGSPLPVAQDFIYNVVPDPRGKFVYVADNSDVIHGFSVDKSTGALTPVPGSPTPTALVGDLNGTSVSKKLLFAFLFEGGSDDVQAFRIGRDGSLTSATPAGSTGTEIDAHVIDAKGKRLLVASQTSLLSARVALPSTTISDAAPLVGADEVTSVLLVKR